MAVGLSPANLANKWLDMLHSVAFTAPAGTFVKLHTGDPGPTAVLAPSSVTTRPALTLGTSAAGVTASTNTPSWAAWAGTNGEVVTHISIWDASSAGNFLLSIALTASKTMGTGDTLNLTSGGTTVSLTPLAA